jgi:hypothetical protein
MDAQWHELARFLPAKTIGRPKQQGLVPRPRVAPPPLRHVQLHRKASPNDNRRKPSQTPVQAKTWPYLFAARCVSASPFPSPAPVLA